MTRGSTGRLSPNHIVSVLNSPSVSSSSSPEPQPASKSNMGRKTSMRTTSPADGTMPVTYTPTTRRISKAKKGKRVHACQYPSCGKVGAIIYIYTSTGSIKLTPCRSSPEPNTEDAMS